MSCRAVPATADAAPDCPLPAIEDIFDDRDFAPFDDPPNVVEGTLLEEEVAGSKGTFHSVE